MFLHALFALSAAELQVGTGIYDATGPITDVVFMGMANPSQKGEGLHFRLRSRAFIALNTVTNKRFAQVSLDAGMGGLVLKNRVVAALKKKYPTGIYNDANVGISGTHTHSGPSGFLEDVIFQFSGTGWVPQTIDTMVEGVVNSIIMAHEKLQPATASLNQGSLQGANINRSPTAYLNNPAEERAMYPDGNTDKLFVQLSFEATGSKKPFGLFNWFAVHPTSMNNTNHLVSGDNKGYASYLFERDMNGPTSKIAPGMGDFVAGFVATNLGDVSPNTKGPHCRDTGLPCDNPTSTCNGRVKMCSSPGPGKDMFESTQIIATKQFEAAKELLNANNHTILDDDVDFIHTYVKMPGLAVKASNGTLCGAAMGDSFAAGTTDGPGAFNFNQGNTTNPLWNIIGGLVGKASAEQTKCQHPKGILLDTENINIPHPWAPDTLPLQLFRLGQLLIVNIPTEMTTMAGRRMRKAMKEVMVKEGLMTEAEGTVVISGLSNAYADYTTTYEEFQVQRYEGGSTIFGPHQLNGYIQEFSRIATAMANGKPVDPGPTPLDFSDHILSNGKKPKAESPPKDAKFGSVTKDVETGKKFVAGTDVVAASFVSGWPGNNLRNQGSFLEVQMQQGTEWTTVAVDGDVETRFHSTAHSCNILESCDYYDAKVEWFIPAVPATAPGTYRLVHYGTYFDKPSILKDGKMVEYNGTSAVFEVVASA